MARWPFTRTAGYGGQLQLIIGKPGPHGRRVNATYVRGTPTLIDNYSDADPFGDAAAQFQFPSITAIDDLNDPELSTWLDYYSSVDLYWVPAVPSASQYSGLPLVMNPLTGKADLVCPPWILDSGGGRISNNRSKAWEGFIASMDFGLSEATSSLTIQCQGANFQVDRYLQKPFYPPQPWPLELLIDDAFSHVRKPHLRTQALRTLFPAAWKLKIANYSKNANTIFTPVGKPGSLWSGYTSRQTGAWEHALTGFVQDQLTVMITDDRSGVRSGNQWTVHHYREGETVPAGKDRLNRSIASSISPGRLPVLEVRDRDRTPDFTLQFGQPGLTGRLSGDSTQSENVIYGSGTGIDGTGWRNAVISPDGSRTDYVPLAASRDIYPAAQNPGFDPTAFASEAYTNFGAGFDQPGATLVSQQHLARDRNPGFTGQLTLAVDPRTDLSRWQLKSGMTLLLKGFAGTGERGMKFHISATTKNPTAGTVDLTVDTRYRDLLTVDEARQRTRDPLTPVKMLQVNRTSVTIEDLQAPWDYTAGSGFIPKESQHFRDHAPTSDVFPHVDWARRHPPLHYPQWYVKCNANASRSLDRWSATIPILTSEKGTISRTEVYAVDIYGRPLKVPFHMSIYYIKIARTDVPHYLGEYSPYLNDAFERTSPETGQQNNPLLWGDDSLIVGWGNKSNGILNRAGFSPGRESDGASPTGILTDDSTWDFDNTNNPNYNKNLKPGQRQTASSITLWAVFYAEWDEPVYFQGRLYRQNPGTA